MRTLWAALLPSLLLVPPAAATFHGGVPGCTQECDPLAANGGAVKTGTEPVDVFLYPHFDGIQRAPLNAQPPAEHAKDENRGPGFLPTVILPPPLNEQLNLPNEMFVWWSSPGFVGYLEDGRAVPLHDEFGTMDDIVIGSDHLRLYFYLSAHNVPNQNSAGVPELGVVPQVGVFARLETGRHPFGGSSTLIAEGDTGDGGRVNLVSLPNQNDNVYEIRVDMPVVNKVIPHLHDELKGGYVATVVVYEQRGDNLLRPRKRSRRDQIL